MLPLPITSPRERFGLLFKQAAGTWVAQAVVQGLGLISGLLIVRLLDREAYALYTIGFAMLGTLAVLADAGVSSGVLAYAGRVWPNAALAGGALRFGFALRNRLLLAAACFIGPALVYLLVKHGADLVTVTAIVIAVSLASAVGASGTLWEVPARLALELHRLQRIQVESALLRLALVIAVGLTAAAAPVMIAAGVIAQLFSTARLKRLALRHVDAHAVVDPQARGAMNRMVRRSLPNALYFCLSGQLTLWLISIFGSTSEVAEVGALSRLGLILSTVNSMVGLVVVPRFARTGATPQIRLRRYVQVQAIAVALGVVVVGFVAVFPAWALLLLGGAYSNLERELVILAAGSCAGMVAATSFAMNNARGALAPGYVNPALSTAVIICALVVLDIGTVSGVFMMSLALNLAAIFAYNLTYLYYWRKGEA